MRAFYSGTKPERHYSGDAGWDLTVSETTVVPANTCVSVPTGCRVALPPGVYGRIVGRSSTMVKKGLLIVEGTVDNGWRGELFVVAYNPGSGDVVVEAGTRIAQLVPAPIVDLVFQRVSDEDFPDGERGTNGFGSTGQ